MTTHCEGKDPGKSRMALGLALVKLLPQTDCVKCGKRSCLAFAVDLARGHCPLDACPLLSEPRHEADCRALSRLLG